MKICFLLLLLAFSGVANAQSAKSGSPQLDSIAKRVIRLLQDKNADSIYIMTAPSFQEKITAENFISISNNQIFPMNDFKSVQYISTTQGINKYKVEGTPLLQLLIGIDADSKIETLLVQPYQE